VASSRGDDTVVTRGRDDRAVGHGGEDYLAGG
jgi:hypothetical protein